MAAVPARHRGEGAGAAGRAGPAPVAALLAVVVLLVAGWPLADLAAGTGGQAAPSSSPEPAAVAAGGSEHVVRPGETYWSIARRLDRPGDLRATVDALVTANGGRPLRAGDRLAVPAVE